MLKQLILCWIGMDSPSDANTEIPFSPGCAHRARTRRNVDHHQQEPQLLSPGTVDDHEHGE